MGDEIIRSHLHEFWLFWGEISREKWVLRGGILPARGGWGEKIRKNAHKSTWQDQK
jgi:hypothetical protein